MVVKALWGSANRVLTPNAAHATLKLPPDCPTPMDSATPTSLRSLLTRIVCTLAGLLLLYVLSIGPANYLCLHDRRTKPVLLKIYAPLDWAVKDKPKITDLLNAYAQWWADLRRKVDDDEPRGPYAPP